MRLIKRLNKSFLSTKALILFVFPVFCMLLFLLMVLSRLFIRKIENLIISDPASCSGLFDLPTI